ncbi:hypothetical protein KA005_32455, partial [bacterium]|nr:hypothetical protein [bacterium]
MDWVLSLSDDKEWGFVGCHATEERSLCSWKLMKEISNLNNEYFLQVTDESSEKYAGQITEALVNRDQDFLANGGDIDLVDRVSLMSELFRINELSQKALNLGESIVLDVTSMPKRFFFPILKKLINSVQVQNLLVTYSSPSKYTDGDLYEDIDSWKNLPGFGGATTERENLIVSIGFLVESLKSYFSS